METCRRNTLSRKHAFFIQIECSIHLTQRPSPGLDLSTVVTVWTTEAAASIDLHFKWNKVGGWWRPVGPTFLLPAGKQRNKHDRNLGNHLRFMRLETVLSWLLGFLTFADLGCQQWNAFIGRLREVDLKHVQPRGTLASSLGGCPCQPS